MSLAFSSTIAVKVLDDSGVLSTLYGRDVLNILILQDIVTIGLADGWRVLYGDAGDIEP